eukprot:808524_1
MGDREDVTFLRDLQKDPDGVCSFIHSFLINKSRHEKRSNSSRNGKSESHDRSRRIMTVMTKLNSLSIVRLITGSMDLTDHPHLSHLMGTLTPSG